MAASLPKTVNVPATSIDVEATLYTPTTGTRFRLLKAVLYCTAGGPGTVILRDTTAPAGTVKNTLNVWAPISTTTAFEQPQFDEPYPARPGLLSGALNNVLTGKLTGATVAGYLIVIEE